MPRNSSYILLKAIISYLNHPKPKFNVLVVLIFQLLTIKLVRSGSGDYCYEDTTCGPSSWGGDCATGMLQSPINLDKSKVNKVTKSVNLVLNKEYAKARPFFLTNDGRTLKLFITPDDKQISPCLIKGQGFLPNEPYYFHSLHFHWGPHDFVGSEHQINGQAYPLELHMIHVSTTDNTSAAVLGILYKISNYDNSALNPILNNLYLVKNYSSTRVPISFDLISLNDLLPKKVKVFRYQGSLTTPPCSEGIIWTVFDDIQTISKNQLNQFRELMGYNGLPILTNFRPIQQTFTGKRKNVYYMKSIQAPPNRPRRNGWDYNKYFSAKWQFIFARLYSFY